MDLQTKQNLDSAALTLARCLGNCVTSFKAPVLMPTEERCTRHCIAKSMHMEAYIDNEIRYTKRNL